VVKEFQKDQKIVFAKNPTYYDAQSIRLAGVEMIHAPTDSVVNVLKAGTADYADVTSDQAQSLNSGGLKSVSQGNDSSFYAMPLCKNAPPFDNVDVRRALNLAIDRDVLNQVVHGGNGEPMRGMWTKSSKLFPADVQDALKFDPNAAKALLAKAGQTGLAFDLYFTTADANAAKAAQVVQQQLNDAGFNATLKPGANIVAEFFQGHQAPAAVTATNRGDIDKVSRTLALGSIGDICDFDNPDINAGIDTVRKFGSNSPEGVAAWATMQSLIIKDALMIPLLWNPSVHAWNEKKLDGVTFVPSIFGAGELDYTSVFVKK
jgi:peptide/nickel transport system substrate-binding protein